MASGRVGGAHSKISGLLGDVVYQVKRNPDGTYSQIVSVKGETTTNYTTPRLQAQRMCTAMVEAMMKQLKPVASISMQSAANKSKSLNAFSSFNLQKVARDCMTHWYEGNQFVYPRHSRYDMDIKDLGGLYMISSGTLQYNIFDRLYHEDRGREVFKDWPSSDIEFYGVQFDTPSSIQTIGQFLQRHGMSVLDWFVFVGFRTYTITPDNESEPVTYEKHSYILAQINPEVNVDAPITDETLSTLFRYKGDHDAVFARAKDNSSFAIGYSADNYGKDEVFYYWAAFSISYADGRKKISSSSYALVPPFTGPWLRNAAPTNVFGSWMDDPGNHHYPSPFQ